MLNQKAFLPWGLLESQPYSIHNQSKSGRDYQQQNFSGNQTSYQLTSDVAQAVMGSAQTKDVQFIWVNKQ